MKLWHLSPDAPRLPERVSPGERVTLSLGTYPIEPGQSVWICYRVSTSNGHTEEGRVDATWRHNLGHNSYWQAELGPFADGDLLEYTVRGSSSEGAISGPTARLWIGPKIYLAVLWHQHQPVYKDTSCRSEKGSYVHPWVRLHAIRDYYSMAALVAQHPGVHLTINLTPTLLWQIEDYLEHGATDQALELTLKRAETLAAEERATTLRTFFDAHWHNQIFPHPRYKELFVQAKDGRVFTPQDLRDLQMWFNLSWFGKEFRDDTVPLATDEVVSVRHFVEKARDFSLSDIEDMVEEQYKIMRAIVPLHRLLQERGQLEISTSPFSHPILPLLVDTDRATIDRADGTHPRRFAHPEDAEAQVGLAIDRYERSFGTAPRGMWPAEGAVSESVIPLFAQRGIRWIATDRGVLACSGEWGYDVDKPEVLCQPYRAEDARHALSVFFRDTQLSNHIGFHYHGYSDYDEAARSFLTEIKERFATRLAGSHDYVLTVVLDGENAWGAYRDDARPFLHALYGLLEDDRELKTVTMSEYLDGNSERGLASHRLERQLKVHDLFTGSWIDENGSEPGVDLGTWIGEEEENRAWNLLGEARDFLFRSGVTRETAPKAFEALFMAEASDWFWWFGADQESGVDEGFDELFRTHLKNVYQSLASKPPAELDRHIVPRAAVWSFMQRITELQVGDRLTVQTNCPGTLTWRLDDGASQLSQMAPAGGVMAGVQRYLFRLGPFDANSKALRFRFRCTCRDCDCRGICCMQEDFEVRIV